MRIRSLFRLTEFCICSCAVCVVLDIPWHKSSSVYAAVLYWERTRSWLGLVGTCVPLAKDRAGQKQSSEEQ